MVAYALAIVADSVMGAVQWAREARAVVSDVPRVAHARPIGARPTM
eukprot:CAMPEP_0183349330 /NCGR_PEP_ID=MMETSP0164_2-20130417/13545_1 /TAXON_ID=221442 /ORGANISM="Coccolithus pelagicus ssp braarudi, Strain PLY182g" /LENGTH=45 /DNA_ID= /DNA_START= /DNA_END= /DNA_ORIENTATION=